jgi:hypothetical protein
MWANQIQCFVLLLGKKNETQKLYDALTAKDLPDKRPKIARRK